MKKQAINFSWPATLSDFSTDTANENFSRGKLKVFYKGETADHRFFSDAFSEELIGSLPYTPVVSYYDEEKDDFVGHATEQQILGIVDPCREPSFVEDEDGTSWCVCDVVLYTERPDKVGDLAKKIVGHSQSLELDPSSVKYTINYDEKKHFKNIEFTAGRFVGVSVLGDDQQPAFTGSSFFAYDEQFENKMKLLREYCETKEDQTQSGGQEMNFNEFMKLSWGDISFKVNDAIMKEYENDAYTALVDMFDDSAIVRFYYYVGGDQKLMRVHFSCDENGVVTLGDVNEVHMTYEDVEEPKKEETGVTQATESKTDVEEEVVEEIAEEEVVEMESTAEETTEAESLEETEEVTETEDVKVEEAVTEEVAEEKTFETTEETEETTETEEIVDAASTEDSDATPTNEEVAQVVNAEVTTDEKKVSVEDETIEETTSSSTSFTESERAEFEALKREEKIRLVDSYKGDLSEESIDHFMANIDAFDKKDLEVELLKAYKDRPIQKPIRAFSLADISNNVKNEDPLDS